MNFIYKLLRFFLILTVPFFFVFVVYIQYLTKVVTEKFSGPKWDIPSKVFSDSFQLYPGMHLSLQDLKEKLERLGYQEVSDQVSRSGEFQIHTESQDKNADVISWDIYLNDFVYPSKVFKGFPISLEIEDVILTRISHTKENNDSKEDLFLIELEPELIAEFFQDNREQREIVKLDAIPPFLLNAIIAIEDARFLEHAGIDPKGILRAFYANLKARSIVQGGSTITQQLVKNFFLTHKKSLIRKINEAIMAVIIESRYSKDEILEAYVNEVYMGQKGFAGIYGVSEGARFYFSKPLKDLSLAESAMLAGIIRGPGVFSPFKNKKLAMERRNLVLKKMLEINIILSKEYLLALQEPIRIKKITPVSNPAPYFVDFVKKELLENYSEKVLNTQGLKIFTTLDVSLQIFADQALKTTLQALETQFPYLKSELPANFLQGAFMAIQPQTGYIKVMIGGRDYNESQFNRISQAYRQVGSLFKPVVFLTAFTTEKEKYTLTHWLSNEPFKLTYGSHIWEPSNYESAKPEVKTPVTIREALERSINIPTARLATEIGAKKIAAIAKHMGIQSPLPIVPSLALGSASITPLEMATVYSVLANNGLKANPISIKDVMDPDGQVLEKKLIDIKKVAAPEAVFLVTYALQGALNQGTGRGVRSLGFNQAFAAGKTGTTNEYMDAWFAGYTPDLVGVAWIGFDKEKKVGLTGAQAALPVWARFMIKAIQNKPVLEFLVPENIVFKDIDPETGQLFSKKCPTVFKEAFIKGTEPAIICELHQPPKKKK